MMSNAVLQVLQILAYLAIGLISVTFPIYAICVTYLRQEKWESEKERKKRIEKIRTRMSELTTELEGKELDRERVTRLREQIEKYEIELKGTELGVKYLTAKGAVGIPVQYLIIALAFASAGIYCFYEGYKEAVAFFGLVSGLFSILAIYSLYKTISAVEYAALRPARTIIFDACYESRQKNKEIKLEEETKLSIGVGTPEENVEKLVAMIYVPPDIQIKRVEKPAQATLQSKGFAFPDYNAVVFERDFVPKNIYQGVELHVLAKKTGRHRIPVRINARGIYEYKTELILNVVK